MATLKDALDLIATLSADDLAALKSKLTATDKSADTLADYTEDKRFSNGRVFPHCGCIHVVRNGHRKDGKQRFL